MYTFREGCLVWATLGFLWFLSSFAWYLTAYVPFRLGASYDLLFGYAVFSPVFGVLFTATLVHHWVRVDKKLGRK